MSDPLYRISNSTAAADQLRSVLTRAEAEGVLPVAVSAARWLVEELERTPFEFGESREYLEYAELYWRIVFVPPMYAFFGIHEPSRTLFVVQIGWMERREPRYAVPSGSRLRQTGPTLPLLASAQKLARLFRVRRPPPRNSGRFRKIH